MKLIWKKRIDEKVKEAKPRNQEDCRLFAYLVFIVTHIARTSYVITLWQAKEAISAIVKERTGNRRYETTLTVSQVSGFDLKWRFDDNNTYGGETIHIKVLDVHREDIQLDIIVEQFVYEDDYSHPVQHYIHDGYGFDPRRWSVVP